MVVPIPDGKTVANTSKILLQKFYCDCMIPKRSKNNVKIMLNFCIWLLSLLPLVKTDDVCEDIRGDVWKRFDTSNTIKQEGKDHYLHEKNKISNWWAKIGGLYQNHYFAK